MMRRTIACVMVLMWSVAARAVAQSEDRVEYMVSLARAAQQVVGVKMVVRVSGPSVDVTLPVWRPGRYEVLDPAGTVSRVRASVGGQATAIEKSDKTTWRITLPDSGTHLVTLEYDVYANALANRTRHADDTHAFLSPSTVLMYVPELRLAPARVRLTGAPAGWRAASGLTAVDAQGLVLDAANYDVLADSPIEIGVQDVMRFDVDGVPHEIAVWWGPTPAGASAAWPGEVYTRERLTADFAAIVKVQRDIFGRLPYERYVFLLHCYAGGGGGTEHLNSTIMQTAPKTFESREAYRTFLGLVSHEMFHTWNVKQFRPAGLQPYNYRHENYTDLLWVAEGTTEYYDQLTLVRADLKKRDVYLKALAKSIDTARSRPGGRVQSVASSSYDAWIKFNRPTPDDPNTTVSFYDEGALVSLALDMTIRESSRGTASLDTLMRELFERFPLSGPGYTDADLRDAASRLAGRDLTGFFTGHVHGTEPVDFETGLLTVGLRLERTTDKGDGDEPVKALLADLGFTIDAKIDPPPVKSVTSDGPAYAAGLLPGDVLLALNGLRVRAADWDRFAKRCAPGEAVSLTIFRSDLLRTVEFVPRERPSGTLTLVRVEDPTAEQKAAYESWLGHAWPESKE